MALATAADEHLRDPAEALRLAKQAAGLAGDGDARAMTSIAFAADAAGDAALAGEAARKALRSLAADDPRRESLQRWVERADE
jgi:cytochrome c-type biogenesis protein CcmH/NrfG